MDDDGLEMTEIYMVRHGQASFFADNYDQLSDMGYQQSRWLGEYFAERKWTFDQSITGMLTRHHQTLDSICEGMNCADHSRQVWAQLDEYDHLNLIEAFYRESPEDPDMVIVLSRPKERAPYYRLMRKVLSAWQEGRLLTASESWSQFSARVAEAREQLINLAKNRDRLLVVSSGGTMCLFMAQVTGMSDTAMLNLSFQLQNSAICKYVVGRHGLQLSGFNLVPHLDREDRRSALSYS